MDRKYRAIIIEDIGDESVEDITKGHKVLFDIALEGEFTGIEALRNQILHNAENDLELMENEEKYRQLFHHSSDAVFVQELNENGQDAKLIEVNETACTLFGYTRDELYKMKPRDLSMGEKLGELQSILKNMGNNSHAAFEFSALTKDRRTINIEFRAHKFKIMGKWILMEMLRDITDRVKIINELKASTMKYEYLLMNMNNAFGYFKVTADNEGTPTDCLCIEMNEAFANIIGINREAAMGKSLIHMVPLNYELRDKFLGSLIKSTFCGEEYNSKEYFFDQLNKWFSVYGYSPEKGYCAIVLVDISDQKKAAEAMKQGMEAANAANHAKSEFLANMSHEIRTPLNGIIGMTNLTLMTELNQVQRDNLMIVKNSADALLNVINDILDISKMEAGKLVIEKITFDIRQVLDKVVKTHSVKANEKGLDFRYLVDKRIPCLLKGDPYRLQQILNNLFSNAVKFTENGSIKIVVEFLERKESMHCIRFAVIDSGIGIAEHDISKLFQNFSQIDASYTKRFGGTGLGLAITKQLAEMMGGTIGVKSEKGKGSIFECILQFEDGKEKDNLDEDEGFQVKKSLSSLSILVVEDDKVNQAITAIMLRNMGHKTKVADNGKQALELYGTGNFDLILMDIQLPEMDGIQATKIIRQKESMTGKHTPIIAFTAYALKGDKERFLEAGMDEYIIKPFKINELYSIIENVSKRFIRDGRYGKMQYEPINDNTVTENEDFVIEDVGKIIERLANYHETKNLNQIEKDAHELKKAASTLGLDKIRIIAFRIELAARREDLSEANILIKELENTKWNIDNRT